MMNAEESLLEVAAQIEGIQTQRPTSFLPPLQHLQPRSRGVQFQQGILG